MSNEELENWYDETYELILLAFLYDDHVSNRSKKIDNLKRKFKSNAECDNS